MRKYLFSAVLAIISVIGAGAQTDSQHTMFVTMRSGVSQTFDVDSVRNVTFAEKTDPYASATATVAQGIYVGDYFDSRRGNYYVCLGSDSLTASGIPTKVGASSLRLLFVTDIPDDPENAKLPSGTYTLSLDSTDVSSIYYDYSDFFLIPGVKDDGSMRYLRGLFQSLTVTVKRNGTNYDIKATGYFTRDQRLEYSYSGPITFENQDPQLPYDVDFHPTALSGNYMHVSANESSDCYTLTLYNTPVDNQGFVVGAGGILNMMVFTNRTTNMDFNSLTGTYSVAPHERFDWSPGFLLEGYSRTSYGVTHPVGTYYNIVNEEGYDQHTGYVQGGSATLTYNAADTTLHVEANLITDNGKTVSVDTTMTLSGIVDYSAYSAPSHDNLNGTIRQRQRAGADGVLLRMRESGVDAEMLKE